jgi:hypothetical protein
MTEKIAFSAKLQSRVTKMMALAEDAANEHEAAVAIAKAQEILLTHNLTMEMFQPDQPDAPAGAVKDPFTIDIDSGYTWRATLLNAVATGNLCFVLTSRSKKLVYLFGTASNIKDVMAMYDWLAEQGERLVHESAEERKREHLDTYGVKSRDTRSFKTSFRHGFASAIQKRLKESRATFDRNDGSTQALTVIEKDAETAAQAYVRRNGASIGSSRGSRSSNREGYSAGRSAGESTNMARTNALGAGSRQLKA